MKNLRLYKKERLCSKTAIDALFLPGADSGRRSAIAYPWRAVWRVSPRRQADVNQFLVCVPKKRLRHAVERVAMRRKCREAYRLNRTLPDNARVDIAFIYVGDSLTDYARTEKSVRKLLAKISAALTENPEETR